MCTFNICFLYSSNNKKANKQTQHKERTNAFYVFRIVFPLNVLCETFNQESFMNMAHTQKKMLMKKHVQKSYFFFCLNNMNEYGWCIPAKTHRYGSPIKNNMNANRNV